MQPSIVMFPVLARAEGRFSNGHDSSLQLGFDEPGWVVQARLLRQTLASRMVTPPSRTPPWLHAASCNSGHCLLFCLQCHSLAAVPQPLLPPLHETTDVGLHAPPHQQQGPSQLCGCDQHATTCLCVVLCVGCSSGSAALASMARCAPSSHSSRWPASTRARTSLSCASATTRAGSPKVGVASRILAHSMDVPGCAPEASAREYVPVSRRP